MRANNDCLKKRLNSRLRCYKTKTKRLPFFEQPCLLLIC